MKVAVPLAKHILALLAIDAGIQKTIHGSKTATLIISNEEVNCILKVVQAVEIYNILLQGVTKTIENETKQQWYQVLQELVCQETCSQKKGLETAGYGNNVGKGKL